MARRVRFIVVVILLPAIFGCGKQPELPKKATGKPFELAVKRRPNSLIERAADPELSPQPSDGLEVDPLGGGVGRTRSTVLEFGATGGDLSQSGQLLTQQTGAPTDFKVFDTRLLEVETNDKRYKEAYERGEALMKKGQYDQALVAFDEAKVIDPKNFAAYVGEASCYFYKREFGKALAAVNFAIADAPDKSFLYANRGQIKAQLGDFRGAIEDFDHVVKEHPRDPEPLAARAQFHREAGNLHASIADYTAALKERPADLMLLISRGWIYYRVGKFKEAAADATLALERQPRLLDAYFLRCAARLPLQDKVGAKADFDEAVRMGLDERLAKQLRPAFYPQQADPNPR